MSEHTCEDFQDDGECWLCAAMAYHDKQERQRESWFAREQRAYLAGLAIGISIGLLVAYLT